MIAQPKSPQTPACLPGYTLPPVPQKGTRVILLRHGRSTLNEAGCYQGSSDTSRLTAKGIAASQAVGTYLANCPIDAIYASPLQRAQETVAALLPRLRSQNLSGLNTSDLLKEIHLPGWEGLRYEAVKSCYLEAYRCWQETPEQFHLPITTDAIDNTSPFYPVQDLYKRAQRFWQTALPHHRGQTLLLVGHGSSNQALINTAIGLSPQQHHALQQTHSGLTVLDFISPADRQAQLHILNLTLGDRLPKLKAGKQGLRLLLAPDEPGQPSYHRIANLLQGEAIHAAILAMDENRAGALNPPAYRQTIPTWLRHHSETVVLPIQRSQFWHHWQLALQRSLAAHTHTSLTTVLAMAPVEPLQQFLQNLLGSPAKAKVAEVTLHSHTLSAVHYPNAHTRPILQGMNLTDLKHHLAKTGEDESY